eukprot:2306051-Rhodomonas_salina.4
MVVCRKASTQGTALSARLFRRAEKYTACKPFAYSPLLNMEGAHVAGCRARCQRFALGLVRNFDVESCGSLNASAVNSRKGVIQNRLDELKT